MDTRELTLETVSSLCKEGFLDNSISSEEAIHKIYEALTDEGNKGVKMGVGIGYKAGFSAAIKSLQAAEKRIGEKLDESLKKEV